MHPGLKILKNQYIVFNLRIFENFSFPCLDIILILYVCLYELRNPKISVILNVKYCQILNSKTVPALGPGAFTNFATHGNPSAKPYGTEPFELIGGSSCTGGFVMVMDLSGNLALVPEKYTC